PAPLVAGTRYRKVLAVLDTSDSFVGGERSNVESSFELVFCHRCFERLSKWLQNPLSEIPPEGEPPAELDEAELEDELEKELFILAEHIQAEVQEPGRVHCNPCGFEHTAPAHAVAETLPSRGHEVFCPCPCRHHPGVDCDCFCRFSSCGPSTCPVEALDPVPLPEPVVDSDDICCPYTSGHERDCPKWPKAPGHGPCLDPDKMLGASDQFGGSDYDEENMP
ncbi:MAG: hypothetical protein AAB875_03835, partial [Patescibacteria group bacterium]